MICGLEDMARGVEQKRVAPSFHARHEADGVFLSCTNTTQIEAIVDIEGALGRPVVNSNQAVLWGCITRLRGALPPLLSLPPLGRLMQHLA